MCKDLFVYVYENKKGCKGCAVLHTHFVETLVKPVWNQVVHRYEMSSARILRLCGVVLPAMFMVVHATATQVFAEVKTVNGRGAYRMGPHDTKEDAVRLAVESAKRNVLEQVATYVESVTVVKGVDVTKDEVRTFTAGLVLVLNQCIATKTDGNADVVEVDLLGQVETEEVVHAIATLRKNEEVRGKLATLKRENERLHREVDSANRSVVQARTSDQTTTALRRRREVLHRAQSTDILSQAWIDWALVSSTASSTRSARCTNIQALLNLARSLDPASQHLALAEQMMATKQPPIPPQPPAPPIPGQVPARMPRHEIVSRPGIGGIPRMLNKVIYRTPGRTDSNRDGPLVHAERGSRPQRDSDMKEAVPERSEQDRRRR